MIDLLLFFSKKKTRSYGTEKLFCNQTICKYWCFKNRVPWLQLKIAAESRKSNVAKARKQLAISGFFHQKGEWFCLILEKKSIIKFKFFIEIFIVKLLFHLFSHIAIFVAREKRDFRPPYFWSLLDSLCERSRNLPNGDASHVTLVGNPAKDLLHFSTIVADLALRAFKNHWSASIIMY